MGRLKKGIEPWMYKLADQYDISVETVDGLYRSFIGKRYNGNIYIDRRSRTEDFLRLYFEGVHNG